MLLTETQFSEHMQSKWTNIHFLLCIYRYKKLEEV